MENNTIEEKVEKTSHFSRRVSEVEKRVDNFDDRLSIVESKLNTILMVLKTRR